MNDAEGAVRRGTGPTIVGFIMARIEEIDALAADSAPTFPDEAPPLEHEMRKFITRECMAKRERIFKIAEIGQALGDSEAHHLTHELYRLEATAWFDHPDYKPEWRIL
jgi:hypothetical protein